MRYLMVTALAALAMLPAGNAEGEWLQKSKNDLYDEEHRAQIERFRDWRSEAKRLTTRHVRWGKEKKANRWNVVTLKPGYRTSSRGKVEVEWFFTYLGLSGLVEPLVMDWMKNLQKETNGKVRLKRSPVASMKGRKRIFNHHHEMHQLIAFTGEAIGRGRTVHRAMRKKLSVTAISLHSQSDLEEFLRDVDIPVEPFHEAAESEKIRKRIRTANAKIDALAARAEEGRKDANLDPRDPIFLINGKYLVQGSLAGSVRNTFRIANWLIRRELEGRRR